MSMDVSTCNLTVNSNENTIGPVHYYRFLTIYMCKYYDKYIKLFSKNMLHAVDMLLHYLYEMLATSSSTSSRAIECLQSCDTLCRHALALFKTTDL